VLKTGLPRRVEAVVVRVGVVRRKAKPRTRKRVMRQIARDLTRLQIKDRVLLRHRLLDLSQSRMARKRASPEEEARGEVAVVEGEVVLRMPRETVHQPPHLRLRRVEKVGSVEVKEWLASCICSVHSTYISIHWD
jgi:ribosomal protein L19E